MIDAACRRLCRGEMDSLSADIHFDEYFISEIGVHV